jgi:hypothetical protein
MQKSYTSKLRNTLSKIYYKSKTRFSLRRRELSKAALGEPLGYGEAR